MLIRIFGGMQALCKDDPEKSIPRTAIRQRPIRPCTDGRKEDSWLPVCPSSLPESDHALPDQHDSKGHDHDDRDAHPLAANLLGGRLGAATVMTNSSPRR